MSDTSPAGPSSLGDAVQKSKRLPVSRTSSREIKPSYIARSGFPLLATSSIFVQEISQEVSALLDSFAQAWSEALEAANHEEESVEPPSPFAIFKGVYVERGWLLFQMYWSEHQGTRLSIFHSFVRTLTDSLRPLLPHLYISDDGLVAVNRTSAEKLPAVEVLRAVGILFALRVVQSTTIVSTPDKSAQLQIPIEADLFHVLYALPSFIQTSKALGEWDVGSELQPIDDVVYVLRGMADSSALDARSNGYETNTSSDDSDAPERESSSVFNILLPTAYEARPALINNRLSTKAETEKASGTWGRLRSDDTATDGVGMSRADLMRNLVRQRLDLSLRGGGGERNQQGNGHPSLVMDAFKVDKRGHSKDSFPVTIPPSNKAEQVLQECQDDVLQQREMYETSKRQRFDGADCTRLLPSSDRSTSPVNPLTTPVEPADLHSILFAARRNVVQSMRKQMKAGQLDR